MRHMLIAALALCLLPYSAHSKKPELPANMTVRPADKRNSYIDTIDFSYKSETPVPFATLKLCIAGTISNNSTSLQDSAGAFVGPATGTYYSNTRTQTVQGGSTFKYLDDSISTLIATGTVDGGSTALGLTRNVLKFDLKASVSDTDVTLRFANILRAQQDTGIAVNDGFQPVGTWSGAKPLKVHAALEAVAARVKGCLH
jgi:hypothetical protein